LSEDKPTSFFNPRGRELWAQEMAKYGYVELPGYIVSAKNYCCGNCISMVEDQRSPTGYWCKKYNFPDRPEGCSDGFEPKSQTPEPGPTA